MSKQRRAGFDLRSAAHDRSFIPARADLPALIELLVHEDDGDAAERAIARAGAEGARAVITTFGASRPPLRGRLVKVIDRIGGHADWLMERLRDEDAKTRRNAIVALGHVATPGVESALLDAWSREDRVEHRRSLAAALGKIGGPRALELLRTIDAADGELRRIASEAILKLERTHGRSERGAIDTAVRPAEPLVVRYHCRRGLEQILVDEIGDLGARGVAPGVVEVKSLGSIAALHAPRTALRFGFPLAVPAAGDAEARVAAAIVSGAPLLSRFTRGPITYRLEWAGRGHRRAATFKVARMVSERAPELRNDPTDSVWEVVVDEELSVEAWPKAAEDPRFAYRVADVPASSHPTIAAALARVGGIRRDEVVWDPFVGAGTELIERARLGAYAAMYGSDVEPAALDAAGKNLTAAGVKALLVVSDARVSRPPEPVSLVLTNPPMGRRVLDRRSLEPLFDGVLANVRNAMRRDGRMVLLSPLFGRTVELAVRHGFRVERRGAVDLGGFDAELQVLEVKRR